MKNLVILSICFLLSFNFFGQTIIGGQPTPIADAPYQVSILRLNSSNNTWEH